MRKHKVELIIILFLSAGLYILVSNFGKSKEDFSMPNMTDFIKWTSIIFVGLTLIYFAKKGAPDKEHKLHVSNGFHELYNDNNQVTQKGIFEAGKLYNGSKYFYKKDGTLLCTEIYKEGVCTEQKTHNN